MKFTLLGTGTSQGIPVIGCDCSVCSSPDPRDQRLRSAALLTAGETNILIDAGPDLRQQMLRERIHHLDAILLTHEHNDHVIGLDDVRPFNFRSGHPIAVYALPRVAGEVRKRFEYVFGDPIPGLPRLELRHLDKDGAWEIGGVSVLPIEVMHGPLPILGYRFGDLTYLTDVKTIASDQLEKIRGTRLLIINALQHTFHPTHLSLHEALALIEQIGPERAWLTHVSHKLGRTAGIEATLPEGVRMGWDGFQIEF